MCMSCGCNKPNEAHGDERNITMRDLEQAAQAGNVTPQQVAQNIQAGYKEFGAEMAGAAKGQTTGNNAQQTEDRQGGYGTGGSNGPQ